MVKQCKVCGQVYRDRSWQQLKHIGNQPVEDDNGEMYTLEMRNCFCGSTLSLELREGEPLPYVLDEAP